ncbi:hypothetical protein K440DRAFT_643501 [Wilcoxina mikolae CBS 423.85]|nr:hypothetical protein K440DRAFT_643501 [Wilcoxina mikolae CBS 423.85]
MQEEDDSYWDILEDSRDRFIQKWSGVSTLKVEEDPILRQNMDRVLALWESYSSSKGSAAMSAAYAQYMTVETNELEGVFQLTKESAKRLVRIGFIPSTVNIHKKSAVYEGARGQPQTIVCMCVDMLDAIGEVHSLSKQLRPTMMAQ